MGGGEDLECGDDGPSSCAPTPTPVRLVARVDRDRRRGGGLGLLTGVTTTAAAAPLRRLRDVGVGSGPCDRVCRAGGELDSTRRRLRGEDELLEVARGDSPRFSCSVFDRERSIRRGRVSSIASFAASAASSAIIASS